MSALGPRASLRDVLRGRARLVGARALDARSGRAELPPGVVSPAEARIAMGLAYEDPAEIERAYAKGRTALRDLGVLARAMFASMVSAGAGRREARPFIVSSRVDDVTVGEAIEHILGPAIPRRARIVNFVHPHALDLAATDAALARDLAWADVVLPDGVGLRVAARILGVSLAHNVNGTDLLPLLCDAAAARGTRIVLVGGAPGVADECARRLRAAHDGLVIEALSDGFAKDFAPVVDAIRARGPCVVLVGMGSPKQEAWARAWLADLEGVTAVTVGGLFDFYSERVTRAPIALREVGLEWLWRLKQEPARLAKRYLIGAPRFLLRAIAQRARGR